VKLGKGGRGASKQPSNGGVNTLLGQGSSFEGLARVQGTVRVDGLFQGILEAGDAVMIGKSGELQGDVRARDVVVSGKLRGTISAKETVELQRGCHLEGDVHTRTLIIEEGVYFQGNCRMDEKEILEPDAVSEVVPVASSENGDVGPLRFSAD
jgi:cytoskeletal protein CcmA (bactofilin family)